MERLSSQISAHQCPRTILQTGCRSSATAWCSRRRRVHDVSVVEVVRHMVAERSVSSPCAVSTPVQRLNERMSSF
eukprot:1911238-Pyramimonas_sp.AAC.1